ncbi:hypothetical protein [Synechococcus sp. CBW1004]|uniref:hypothetical protein n=1 Tax=Synechococcus sp. CBW1004 TaxID=1353136 RepID=UPI0018CF9E56|nr:hypothetical protein [Synechococcus sp. CBW1004]QPN62438.1 hypothetical protein H8F25_12045 [Synechococcus sp. CBW1004]
MADSALSTDLLERYGAIEQAYCQERWTSVIHDGQTLLGDLSRVDDTPPEGLTERLQLLIAHALLYGLGDRDSAEDLYQAVLRSGAEASLRQIAEQGLQQCALPVTTPEPQQEQGEQQVDPQPDSVAAPTGETSLWPEAAAAEAELQTDPGLSSPSGSAPSLQEGSVPLQGLQDDWGAATSQPAAGEEGALGWLTAAATAAPQEPAAGPVMPWLEAGAAGEVFQPAQASRLEDPAVLQDRQESDSGSPPSQIGPTGASLEALPDQANLSATAGMADRTTDVEPPPVADGASLLSPEPMTGLQSIAASGDIPIAGGDVVEAFNRGLQASPPEERLVPEVVDEPELIELHQADSLLREELLVPAVAEEVAPPLEAEPDVEMQAPAEADLSAGSDLSAGLERRGQDGIPGGFQDRRAEPPLAPVPAQEPAPVSPDPRPQVVSGRRPFSGPPEPVAEEDPELLMGLLRVEMG